MSERVEVDLDLLADYAAGALDGTPDQDRVAELIATDDTWRRQYELLSTALGDVDRDLKVLADTAEPMPDDIAARFDELLSGPEMMPPDPAPARPGVGERTLERRNRRAGWRRWAAPVSIAAGVLAIAGLVLPDLLSRSALDMHELNGTAGAPPAATQQDQRALYAAEPPVTFSGIDYTRSSLESFSKRTNAGAESLASGSAQPHTAQVAPGARDLAAQPMLDSCLNEVSKALPGTIASLDFAFFEGTPALIISIQAADGPWLLVTGMECGQQGPNELYRVKTG